MFDIEDYQRLAMRTSPEGHDRILNGCMGLIGESGEVVDLVKKWKFQSGDHAQLPKDKMIEELGDVLWYCAEVSTGMGSDMIRVQKRRGLNGLTYDGKIHLEVLFLSKLAQSMTDVLIYADEWSPDPMVVVIRIMDVIGYMLKTYCGSTLEECMERNIEKLKKRYPCGFSPERSIHREEYE